MILSFNIIDMLPYVWNGLVQIDEARPGSVPQVRNPVAAQWITERRNESPNGMDFTRVKRQTIRALTSDHWLKLVDNPDRYKLDLYWKNQYAPERRRLATVACKGAQVIWIEHGHLGVTTIGSETSLPTNGDGSEGDELWHRDGFDNLRAMRDYFVPKPGDRFAGVLIRW
jgi:hypothetical protein